MSIVEPVRLYAYLDISNPLVAWEVAIGRMKSVSTNNRKDFGLSLWQFGVIEAYIKGGYNLRIVNELILERIRQELFPDNVSRLNGLYFFENLQDIKFALPYWGIPLDESSISEVLFYPETYTKVDSEWITANICQESNESWMVEYWAGKPKSNDPIYEILTNGIGIVLNTELRKKAYQSIINNYPESTPLLAMATCAFHYRNIDNIARIVPGMNVENDELHGGYFINIDDLKDNEKSVIEAIDLAKKEGKFPPIKIPDNPETFFRLPDFQKFGFSTKDISIVRQFRRVHRK